jgi:chloride channel 3/4/5
MEMVLFDLKEGFCSTSWSSPKRFCCAPGRSSDVGEQCDDWVEWGEFFASAENVVSPIPFPVPEWEWSFGRVEISVYAAVAVRYDFDIRIIPSLRGLMQ